MQSPTSRHLNAAQGYLDLGMYPEAHLELKEIDPADRHLPTVICFLISFYSITEDWPQMAIHAHRMVELQPENPGWWSNWAYATRRAQSLEQANSILIQAVQLHPADALIQFNLGCYACQLGQLDEAKSRVNQAVQLDPQFKSLALTDPDLQPLRNTWEC